MSCKPFRKGNDLIIVSIYWMNALTPVFKSNHPAEPFFWLRLYFTIFSTNFRLASQTLPSLKASSTQKMVHVKLKLPLLTKGPSLTMRLAKPKLPIWTILPNPRTPLAKTKSLTWTTLPSQRMQEGYKTLRTSTQGMLSFQGFFTDFKPSVL